MTNDQIELEYAIYRMSRGHMEFGDFLEIRHGVDFYIPDKDRSTQEYAAKLLDRSTGTIGALWDDLEHSIRFPRTDAILQGLKVKTPILLEEAWKQELSQAVHGKLAKVRDISEPSKHKTLRKTHSES